MQKISLLLICAVLSLSTTSAIADTAKHRIKHTPAASAPESDAGGEDQAAPHIYSHCGYINQTGKEVIPLKFSNARQDCR